jgi:Site-specific recombinases, DNA invertase Pin homologs
MSKIGYIRVSSEGQNTQRQEIALKEIGVEKIYREKISGKDINRPQLQKMLEYIREDDVVYIESISRLGRSLKDLLDIVEILNNKGVGLVSLKENHIDTTTPQGKLIFNIFATLSEFERETIKQKQKEGIIIAKANGVYKGRKKIELKADSRFEKLYREWKDNKITAVEFMGEMNLKRNTFYRRIKEYEIKI